MASPLLLALSASAALIAGPALACEGQACWGMAPAQDLNPGYTGPDYSQFEGPGPDGYGPGDPQDFGPGAGPGPGPGDRYGAADDQRAYIGPIEGLRDQQQARAFGSAQAYGYGAQPGYGPGPGYDEDDAPGYGAPDDGADYGGPGAGGADVYGPPRDYSPSNEVYAQRAGGYGQSAEGYGADGYGPDVDGPDAAYGLDGEGEPASAYAMARPAPAYGYERHSLNRPYRHHWMHDAGPGPMAAVPGETPPPPYQTYAHDGYERYAHSPPSASGYRSRSYQAGDISEYNYDSGWVEDTGAQGWSRSAPDWTPYPPMHGPRDHDAPPCGQCAGAH